MGGGGKESRSKPLTFIEIEMGGGGHSRVSRIQ